MAVAKLIEEIKPDYVFHLAAQPLVRQSYAEPVETYSTNIMGTVHVLDALRLARCPCVFMAITTDKCYENKEWIYGYREEDAMGGYDPYSSSKGAAELVVAAYRRSFFLNPELMIRVASARAGNVIGGGDWASDRDCARLYPGRCSGERAFRFGTKSQPDRGSVLEPLSGYLWLGACLANRHDSSRNSQLASAFNFGPALASNRTVAELVLEVLKHWPGTWEDKSDPRAPHEATLLNLAIDKAAHSCVATRLGI